jgi:hypothetical protein
MRTHRTCIVALWASVVVLASARIALAAGPPPPPPPGSYLAAKFCGQVGDCDPWTSAEGEAGQSGDPYYVALGETINFTDESVVMIPNPDGYHSGDPDYITKREWRVDDGDWTELPSGSTTWTWSPEEAGTYTVMERVWVSGVISAVGSAVLAVKSAVSVTVTPSIAYLSPGKSKQFTAKAKDENEKELDADFSWSATLGSVDPPNGKSTTFKAGETPGEVTVTAKHTPSNKEGSATVYVVDAELKNGVSIVDDGDFVYVTDAPQMPQLTARLKPDGLAGNADWNLEIEFTRPNRDDKDTLIKSVAADAQWNIVADFGNHFYGGKGTLTATCQGVECKLVFHIRGENPSENAAETEISDNPFYAKAIARHESGTQDNRTYLQFNEDGALGADYLIKLKHTPNRSGDGKGWGIYQLTNPAPSRDEVWSWKANVAAGKALMNSNLAEAPSYFQAVQRKYPDEYEDPPATYTPPGTTTELTYIQAAAIQMFNGSSVREELPTPGGGTGTYRSCWKFHPNNPGGQRWEFVPNQNDYVKKIIEEYEDQ